jgi:hypothetical protein
MVNVTYKYTPHARYTTDLTNSFYTLVFDKLAPSVDITTVSASATVAVDKVFDHNFEVDAPFGAAIEVSASASYTGKVTINGYDYLGQLMTEEITANGTTAVMGVKCFKYISKITCASGAAVTVTLKRKLILGLPYKTIAINSEVRDGAKVTTSQIVAPVLTAGTATSSDPRGKLNLATYAAAAYVKLILIADDFDSATVGGGLFGVPHYHA